MTDDNGIHDAGEPRPHAARMPQSGHGIASFVIALVSGLVILASITFSALIVASGDSEEHIAVFGFVGIVICAFLVLALAGLILGFIALRRQDRRRTFGAIGLGLNALILVGTAGLMLVGTFFSHSNS
jgi:CHASE2 domain-containing sensor protein